MTVKLHPQENAVKSALTGQTVLLPTDDVEEYKAMVNRFHRDLAPVGEGECELVQSIANAHWRLRRIEALEFALYAHGHEQFADAFPGCPEQDRYNKILLQAQMTYERQFRNYQIQEARLERKRVRDLAQLEKLQADRKQNAGTELLSDDEDQPDLQVLLKREEEMLDELEGNWRRKNGFDFSNRDAGVFNGSSETVQSSQSPLPLES